MEKKEAGKIKESLKTAADWIKKKDKFALISHYDADGLTAAGIMGKTLQRENKEFKTKNVKQLYSETVKEIQTMGENFIFTDFGSALIPKIEKNFKGKWIVLDHHQPKTKEQDSESHVNPAFFGLDGGKEISGSGLAYLLAKEMSEKNKDLSALAIVGAVGDMQDFSGKLIGKNREIMEDGIKEGVLGVKNDLRLYGRISRPLTQFLCYSSSPILPELTANEQKCSEFLKTHKIELREGEQWRSYEDLDAGEKQKLASAIAMHLAEHNTPEWKIRSMIGEVYTLKNEELKSPLRDAKEYATLLNACGRHAQPEIGLSVTMGDREEEFEKAILLLAQHRKELRAGIELMQSRGVEEYENFYFFDAGNEIKDSIVGIVAGMLYGSGAIPGNKPVIAFAMHEDKTIKVSGRGTQDLLRKGLNLGQALKDVCAELGESAEGGGHKIAAGCRIEEKEKEEFLKILDTKIKENYT